MKKILCQKLHLLILIFPILFFLFPVPVHASDTKIITVGYYSQEGFQEGKSDKDRKSGYGYEYLQKIAGYTGWEYRYVYGTKKELTQKLQNGEIDLLAGFTSSEIQSLNLSSATRPFASETCYIYKRLNDNSVHPDKPENFQGKTVAILKGSLGESYFSQYREENGLSCTVVEYTDTAALRYDFQQKQTDMFVTMDMNCVGSVGIVPFIELGKQNLYVAVSSAKPDILKQLNDADDSLRNEEPFYLIHLFSSYYQNYSTGYVQSEEESTWLETHSELKIGYLKNYLPYSGEDEKGNLTGFLKDYINEIHTSMNLRDLKVETVPFDSLAEAYDSLSKSEIDVIFPYYEDTWYADVMNMRESSTVYSQTIDLVFSGDYSEQIFSKIAVSANDSIVSGYTERYYPDSQIVDCKTQEECIHAVREGKADSAIMSHYKADYLLSQSSNQSLHSISLSKPCDICFAVNGNDYDLISLLNRGIRIMGDDTIASSLNRYAYQGTSYTFLDFILDHIIGCIAFIACALVAIMIGTLYYIHSIRETQKETQKARNQLVIALQKEENANKAKSTFLFNMSHDIRTPMNAILGYADLLNINDSDRERQESYIHNIRTAGEYLLELINEVLEMSRIESGKESIQYKPENLNEMLASTEIVVKESLSQKHMHSIFSTYLQNPYVLSDQTKEKTILLNILSNSIKYTPPGGTITCEIHELPEKEGVVIHRTIVKDNGIGMSKEFLPHIFDSFSREKNSTDSNVIGTGLGMGIVKKYVDMLHGTIHVESSQGKGTTTTIDIPHTVSRPFAEKDSSYVCDPSILKGKHVLLAEDNLLNSEIATEILKNAGLTVTHVKDGLQCLQAMQSSHAGTYDFILMDLQMPLMNGLDSCRRIRLLMDPGKAGIPIIALTANAFDSDRDTVLSAGMDGFCPKPIHPDELCSEICRILSERKNR